MSASKFPHGGQRLPRVALGNLAAGARMLADEIPAAITQAEARGATEVVEYLRMALLAAERTAAHSEQDRAERPR